MRKGFKLNLCTESSYPSTKLLSALLNEFYISQRSFNYTTDLFDQIYIYIFIDRQILMISRIFYHVSTKKLYLIT